MKLRKILFLITVISMAGSVIFSQGTFSPRDANEAYAWRLYNQYLITAKNIAQLKGEIAVKRGDISTTSKSSIGAAGADPKDVAQLTKLRQQLKTEEERLKNLETVWNQKFFGRYGSLSDSAETIYDPQTKQTMDKIRFRIIYNRFDPKENDKPSFGKTGLWTLSDVKREIKRDASYKAAEWSGGDNSVTGEKRYRPANSDKDMVINSAFYWQGIPKVLHPNETIKVKVNLNQSVNTETGYGSWIKIYFGEVGGVESDGPEVQLGWRESGKSASTEGSFTIGSGNGKPFKIRVFCKIAGDNYQVIYTYLFNQTNEQSSEKQKNIALNRPAQQSSISQWSKSNDAKGAVDGVKNGSFGFHTNLEKDPWWQVDLGENRQLSEIRIFNRLDYNPERARTIQVLLSNDGSNWKRIFSNNGSIFGGFDGKPLKVSLTGKSARFVRLQLAETNYLHLDEVEIY